jgi:hypothetical protein
MMNRVGVAAMLVAVLGSPAQAADCLRAHDLDAGIRATYADGTWADYRAAGDDRVLILESPDPATRRSYRITSRFGLYDLEAIETDGTLDTPETRIATAYSVPEADLPPPEPGTVWSGRAALTRADGSRDEVGAFYVFNRTGDMAFGSCVYPTITVKAAFFAAEGWMSQEFLYFPTLGFAAVVASQIEDEPESWRAELTTVASAAP